MENNKKQTAIDWLVSEYFGGINNVTPNFRNKIEQAKEMEKEQLIVAYEEGRADILQEVHRDATYKKGY